MALQRPRKKYKHRIRKGRPRKWFKPRVEFTPEAYHILEAAATVVLRNLGISGREYVTKEDLISNAYLRTFMYVQKPEDVKERLFVWAQIEMVRYINENIGPRRYSPLDIAITADDAPYDRPDPNELDDPVAVAMLNECLAKLTPKERRMVREYYLGGRTCREIGRRYHLTGERIRQLMAKALSKLEAESSPAAHRKESQPC